MKIMLIYVKKMYMLLHSNRHDYNLIIHIIVEVWEDMLPQNV